MTPDTLPLMRAAVLRRYDPDVTATDLVQIEDVPAPEVAAPDDVIVAVRGAGVCRSDLHILRGEPIGPGPVPLPHVLGHETAGVVAEVGSSVTIARPGDPVLCYPFLASGLSIEERYGRDSRAPERVTPGITAPGGYGEFVRVTERALVVLPEGTDPAPLAPLTDAGLAVYRACRRVAAELSPGSSVAVVGIGGLGHLAVQILRALTPAVVLAVDPKPAAQELAVEVGADATAAELQAGAGLDAVVDCVGADDTARTSLDALGIGGRYLAVGIGGTITLPVQRLVETELRLEGSFVGTYPELWELTRLALDGRLRVVTQPYPLEEASRALHDLHEGRVRGRAILVP